MSVDELITIFKKEFKDISTEFAILRIPLPEIMDNKDDYVYHPGVYVFWYNDKIIRVGKSFSNSRKRASQHITDNTHNEKFSIAEIANHRDAILILFNIIDQVNVHWVSALEVYFEKNLNIEIAPQRSG